MVQIEMDAGEMIVMAEAVPTTMVVAARTIISIEDLPGIMGEIGMEAMAATARTRAQVHPMEWGHKDVAVKPNRLAGHLFKITPTHAAPAHRMARRDGATIPVGEPFQTNRAARHHQDLLLKKEVNLPGWNQGAALKDRLALHPKVGVKDLPVQIEAEAIVAEEDS